MNFFRNSIPALMGACHGVCM